MFETIAVIDPNSDRRNIFYEVLTELNYKVTTLPSAKELQDLLKRDRPKCIILAVEQPPPSQLVRELRMLDKAIKLVVLMPAGAALGKEGLANDPRVLILEADTDRLRLIRSILGFLKTREVERVEPATAQGEVLLIEDDVRATELLTGYLERRGYKVTSAPNGEAALVQVRIKAPKVIILDMLLPGMDGLLTLKRLKAIHPAVPIIVCSGLEDLQVIEEAKAAGASTYLVKPFDLARLEAAILTSTLQQLKNG